MRTLSESTAGRSGSPERVWSRFLACSSLFAFPVPYPPSTNNAYATITSQRTGKQIRVKTKAARDFQAHVADMVAITRARSGTPKPPYRLLIDLFAPDYRRRDVDNAGKLLQDAICAVLSVDDSQIEELIVTKRGVDREHPRAEVLLETFAALLGQGAGEDGGRDD